MRDSLLMRISAQTSAIASSAVIVDQEYAIRYQAHQLLSRLRVTSSGKEPCEISNKSRSPVLEVTCLKSDNCMLLYSCSE